MSKAGMGRVLLSRMLANASKGLIEGRLLANVRTCSRPLVSSRVLIIGKAHGWSTFGLGNITQSSLQAAHDSNMPTDLMFPGKMSVAARACVG